MMITIIRIFITILILVLLFILIYSFISYSNYKAETINYDHEYGKINFKTFYSYLKSYTEKADIIDEETNCKHMDQTFSSYTGLIFSKKIEYEYPYLNQYHTYIFAKINPDVIEFDDKYMLLNFWSYIRFLFWYYCLAHRIKKDDIKSRRNDNMFSN